VAEKLFVGNLPYDTDNAALEALFRRTGPVLSASIIVDRQTRRGKGFGFVEIADDERAQSVAEELNGSDFNGRALTVSVARPKVNLTESSPPESLQERGGSEVGLLPTEDGIRLVELGESVTSEIEFGGHGLARLLYTWEMGSHELGTNIKELEHLINSKDVRESDFQSFFEQHAEFLTAHQYSAAHPHLVLSRDGEGPLIPDFLLEPFDQNDLADLLELKLPNVPIVVGTKDRRRLSAKVAEASAQLRTYRDYFEDRRNIASFQERSGLTVFRPHMFVLIGRRPALDPVAMRRIEGDVTLWTYDDIIDRARRLHRRP
jgi:hypothetical protein